jgi:hypothetical protein
VKILYGILSILILTLTHYNNATSITTQPGQFIWPAQSANIEPGTLYFQTTISNDATTSPEPHIILAFKNNTDQEASYQIHISYVKAESKYSIFVTTQNSSGITGTTNIQKLATDSVWELLEQWRTGTEQILNGSYTQGTFLLSLGGKLLWLWTDETPDLSLTTLTISSIDKPLQYKNFTISSTIPPTTGNTPFYLSYNPTTPMLLTFTSTTVPETLSCSLFKSSTEKAQYIIDFETKNRLQTTITHRQQPSTKSSIPTSNGSYTLASPIVPAAAQTYFLFYSPSTQNTLIAFGLLTEAREPQTLMYWQNPSRDEMPCTCLSITSTISLSGLTLSASPISPTAPALLGLIKDGANYKAQGLNGGAAYKNNSNEWAYSFAFPQADAGVLSFDVQLQSPQSVTGNGAVILLGTQASGQPLYGIVLEPDAPSDTNTTTATRTRVRIFSLATGVMEYAPSSALIEGHILNGRYQITYKKNSSTGASIALHQITQSGAQLLTTLSLDKVNSGICCATLSSQNSLVTYSNVALSSPPDLTSTAAPAGVVDLDSLSVITRAASDPLDFNWNHSALQQVFDATNGINLQARVQWTAGATSDKTIVIGLSPTTIDPTKKYFFNDAVARFIGATQLLTITIKEKTIIFRRFLPTPEGTNSAIASQVTVEKTMTASGCSLWLSYGKKEGAYTVSVGLDTEIGISPLFIWNDTRTTAANDFAKVGLSAWTTALTYTDIKLTPYTTPKVTTNPASDPAPTQTPPNTLTRTKNDQKLEYLWALGKTSQNPNGIINKQYGGMLTATVQITERDALNTATLMIGLTSDTSSTAAARASGVEIFKGAEYNIQIQATEDNGFVSLRRAVTSGDSPYDGADTVTPYKKLTQKESGTAQWPSYKIWVRYTPRLTSRLFEIGLNDLTDSAQASDYTKPLWSFTEANVPATRTPVQYIGISSWLTGCVIKDIAVSATLAPPATPEAQGPTDDGTITGTNFPQGAQWNTALITMKPNTIHKLTTFGTENSRAVIAFSKSTTTPRTVGFRVVLTGQGASLYEGNSQTAATSSLKQTGNISPDGATYWIKIVNGVFSFGGYAADGTIIETPYLTWTHDMLTGSNTWFFTTGASSDATITYLSGAIIKTIAPTNPTLPAVIRTNTTVGPKRSKPSAAPTKNAAGSNSLLTSSELENQRYRINKPMPAKPAAPLSTS